MNKNKVVPEKPGASSCARTVSVRFQALTPPRCCAHCVPAFVCSAVGHAPWSSSIHTPGPKPCSAPTARRPPPPGSSAQASPPPSTCAVMAVPAELVSPQALPRAALWHGEDWPAHFCRPVRHGRAFGRGRSSVPAAGVATHTLTTTQTRCRVSTQQ